MRKSIGLMVLTGMMTACAAQTHTTPITPISALKLLAVQEIPYDARFKGTTVGGLSGIDYDSTQQSYYLISDDRSALQPARFYTMKVYLNNQGFDSLRITDVVTLRQPDGYPFPNTQQDPAHTPDPEALRYDPVRKQMVWTSEGKGSFQTKTRYWKTLLSISLSLTENLLIVFRCRAIYGCMQPRRVRDVMVYWKASRMQMAIKPFM